MHVPAHLWLLALLAASVPAMAQPLEPEQASLLEKAREAALRYSNSLPDFLCTEVVHRVHDMRQPTRPSRPQAFGDKLTIKLSYFEHKEDYKLMEIDGKPTQLGYMSMRGVVTTGEFGTRLYSIFDPRSLGEFRWKGWSTLRKRRVARFWYHVARENSVFEIRYEPVPESRDSIIVPYHGEVYVDEETHMVLRYTQQAEIPAGFPVDANESTVDYQFAEVGGKRYLLPSHAYVTARSVGYAADIKVEFRDYRKFQAETTITFEPPAAKK